jgi:hypothetical protein
MSTDLNRNIELAILAKVEEFALKFSTTYSGKTFTSNEVIRVWNGEATPPVVPTKPSSSPEEVVPPKEVVVPPEEVVVPPKEVVVPTKPSPSGKVCQHVWSKGARKGTICGIPVNNPTRCYCGKHIAQHKKPTPTSSPVKNKGAIVLRRHKSLNKLWHQESGMVFKSIEDKQVVGRCIDSMMYNLTDEDRTTCTELGFAVHEVEIDPPVVNVPVPLKEVVVPLKEVVVPPKEVVVPPEEVVQDQISEVTGLLKGMLVGGDDSDESDIEEEE